MRFTTSVALLAAVVAARPQDQTISQISDGQIQAPPATPEVPGATTGAVVPTGLPGTESVVVPVPVPTSGGEVAPSVPAGAETSVVVPGVPTNTPPVPGATTTPVVVVPGGNTTVPSGTSSPSGTSGGSESSGTPSGTGSTPEGTGAASANMASFGGIAIAIAGFMLA